MPIYPRKDPNQSRGTDVQDSIGRIAASMWDEHRAGVAPGGGGGGWMEAATDPPARESSGLGEGRMRGDARG